LVKPFQRGDVVRAIDEGVRWSIAQTQRPSARRS
jgi:hypothetical protein